MRALALMILLGLVASAAELQKQIEAPPKAGILGLWRVVDPRIDKIGLIIEWEFTDKEVIVWDRTNNEEVSRSRYSADTTKSPNWITAEIDDSPDEKAGDRRLGIFRIQDGQLHLKQEITNGGKRPSGFDKGFSRFKRVDQKKPKANPKDSLQQDAGGKRD